MSHATIFPVFTYSCCSFATVKREKNNYLPTRREKALFYWFQQSYRGQNIISYPLIRTTTFTLAQQNYFCLYYIRVSQLILFLQVRKGENQLVPFCFDTFNFKRHKRTLTSFIFNCELIAYDFGKGMLYPLASAPENPVRTFQRGWVSV